MTPRLAGVGPTGDVERFLRRALEGRRLICEIGIDLDFREEVLAAFKVAFLGECRGSYERAASVVPALLATTVTVDAVFAYEAGDLWGKTRLDYGSGTAIGRAFTASIHRLGLETFPLFDEQMAARYVSRILAHGGVPVYCLGDLFRLVHHARARGVGDQHDVIELLQDGGRLGLQLDRPVVRFLCSSGRVGADFLQRVLDLPDEAESAISNSDLAARIGLPQYVVNEYRRVRPSISGSAEPAAKVARARLMLERDSLDGPELLLPPVDLGLAWRVVHEGGEADPVYAPFGRGEAVRILVAPASRWRGVLEGASAGVARSFSIGGVGPTRPALVFRGDRGGDIVADPRFCPTDSVLVLAPCALSCEGTSGRIRDSWILEAPEWAGWVVHDLFLQDTVTLSGRLGLDKIELALSRQEQPELHVSNWVPGVSSGDGHQVLDGAPVVTSVPWGPGEQYRWQVSVSGLRSGTKTFVPAESPGELSAQLRDVVGQPLVPLLTVRLLGPMGGSVRISAAVVDSLRMEGPAGPLFPEDAASVSLSAAPGLDIIDHTNGPGPSRVTGLQPRFTATVYHGSGEFLVLTGRCAAVRWRLLAARESTQLSSNALRSVFHAETESRAALLVDVGTAGKDARITVTHADGGDIREVARSCEQVLRADLTPQIRWAVEQESLRFQVHLECGDRSILLAELEESITVNLESAEYLVTGGRPILRYRLSSGRALAGRSLRLTSLDRPWARPVLVTLDGDGAEGEVACSRLRPGRYGAELVLVDVSGSVRVPSSSQPAMFEIPWEGPHAPAADIEDERELLVEAIATGAETAPALAAPRAAAPAAALLLGTDACNTAGANLLLAAIPIHLQDWIVALDEAASMGASRSAIVRAAVRVISIGAGGAQGQAPAASVTLARLYQDTIAGTDGAQEDFGVVSGCAMDVPLGDADILGANARMGDPRQLAPILRELRRVNAAPLSVNGRSRGLLEVRAWGLSPRPEEPRWLSQLVRSYPIGPASLELLPTEVSRACKKARAWHGENSCPDGPAVSGIHVASFEAAAHVAFATTMRRPAGEFLATVAKTFPAYVESRLAYFLRVRSLMQARDARRSRVPGATASPGGTPAPGSENAPPAAPKP